jgi:hypothetical protein
VEIVDSEPRSELKVRGPSDPESTLATLKSDSLPSTKSQELTRRKTKTVSKKKLTDVPPPPPEHP